MVDEILLSSLVTVTRYHQFERDKDQNEIADFIRERFTERYITPLCGATHEKHGFCTMAICCLMIEALESFWRGWDNSRGKSREAFCYFFDRSPNLSDFRGHASDFYEHVRCGILHQAETMNGWLIRRKGPLLDLEKSTINATKFHDEMKRCLSDYTEKLKESDWNDEIWKNLRKKMKAIITHCSTG